MDINVLFNEAIVNLRGAERCRKRRWIAHVGHSRDDFSATTKDLNTYEANHLISVGRLKYIVCTVEKKE